MSQLTTTRSVLLVDDVPGLRLLVRVVLDDTPGFAVVGEAGTGAEAIAAADALQPDVVLLDMSMPHMDGLEALPEILAAAPDAKVVVLTGLDPTRIEPVVMRLGATGCIQKGLPPDALVDRLVEIIEDAESR